MPDKMGNAIVETSILYIILSLAALPLLAFLYFLFSKLFIQQVQRIKFLHQINRLEEGVAANAQPVVQQSDGIGDVGVGGDGGGFANANPPQDDGGDSYGGLQYDMTPEQAHQQASEDMKRWKQARDLFVKRGGQGDLAEVLRSQSRASGAYRTEDDGEQEGYHEAYTREWSPPPRIPTL